MDGDLTVLPYLAQWVSEPSLIVAVIDRLAVP